MGQFQPFSGKLDMLRRWGRTCDPALALEMTVRESTGGERLSFKYFVSLPLLVA